MVSGRESRRAFHQPPAPSRLHEEVARRTPRVAQEVSAGISPQNLERNRERKTGIVKKKPAAEKKTKPATSPEPDSSVAVNCAHVRMEKADDLKPHPRNPNSHPEEQIKLLANIIAKTGWRSPIVVSKRSGFVTKGHGRLMAAKLLGLKSVPVDFQDYPDDAAELADMVADNRIAELAEFDRAILKDILADLDTGSFDMLTTGFDLSAIEALMTAAAFYDETQPPESFKEVDDKIETEHECPKCGYKWSGGK